MYRTILSCVATSMLLNGCMSAGQHRAEVRDESTDRLTVGTVQREVRVGMAGSGVVQVLGAPNVVTTDENRLEVWVYDKVATETVQSSSAGGVSALILGGSGDLAGGAVGGASRAASATSRTQRTLTIVIRMDADGRVRDFSYRASQF
jgi:hypothetical protein